MAQLNFSGLKLFFFSPNFEINNLATKSCVNDWGMVAPGMARVLEHLAGLRQEMLS